ncbi:MAG: hypothetical protein H6627_03710 [Calditrichae bacterium]|nr:hypothetical protein [Calditrichota bacterium]MCB9057646.1 hypothetical protein [Calditrichia bacterium]
MAKYNLLEDDDIFDEEDDFSGKDKEDKVKPEPEPEQTNQLDIEIDDDLLNDEPDDLSMEEDIISGKSMQSTILDKDEPEISIPENEEQELPIEEYEPQVVDREEEKSPEITADKPYLTEDYADEKQTGINYKPIVISAAIIVALIAVYFIVDIFILSASSEPEVAENTTQQPVKTPEQIRQEQEAAAKTQFLAQLAGETQKDVNNINTILDNISNTAKLSSILLYDKSLLLEVFGTTRAEIAKTNINLKNKMADKSFVVVSSQSRPGPNGGVFGLFKADINGGSSAASKNVNTNFNTIVDAQNWLKQQSANEGLKVKSIDNHFVADEKNFKKFNVETTIHGSMAACKNLLNKLSSNGSQLKINKLNLTAADQKNFQSKNFQLKLVLEVFV